MSVSLANKSDKTFLKSCHQDCIPYIPREEFFKSLSSELLQMRSQLRQIDIEKDGAFKAARTPILFFSGSLCLGYGCALSLSSYPLAKEFLELLPEYLKPEFRYRLIQLRLATKANLPKITRYAAGVLLGAVITYLFIIKTSVFRSREYQAARKRLSQDIEKLEQLISAKSQNIFTRFDAANMSLFIDRVVLPYLAHLRGEELVLTRPSLSQRVIKQIVKLGKNVARFALRNRLLKAYRIQYSPYKLIKIAHAHEILGELKELKATEQKRSERLKICESYLELYLKRVQELKSFSGRLSFVQHQTIT